MVDPDFFIILDRLHETLTKRMNRWHREYRKYNVTFLGFCRNKKGLAALLLERMTVAYDLAAAFFYLHENRYVVLVWFALLMLDDIETVGTVEVSHFELSFVFPTKTAWYIEVSRTVAVGLYLLL